MSTSRSCQTAQAALIRACIRILLAKPGRHNDELSVRYLIVFSHINDGQILQLYAFAFGWMCNPLVNSQSLLKLESYVLVPKIIADCFKIEIRI
jgi:hypothetical protein